MRHAIPDDKFIKEVPFFISAYSCEHEDGRRSSEYNFDNLIRMGEGGNIVFIPCESCYQQILGQVLRPILIEAQRSEIRSRK